MRRRAPNPRRAKIHRSYSVDEIARLFRVHRNTVRNWLKRGLPANDERRPTLILGWQLREFLEAERTKRKQRCPAGHFYCVRCRQPKAPALGMADYIPYTATTGNLRGICPDCGRFIHRRVALDKIDTVRGQLDVQFPEAHRHIAESGSTTVNCDSDRRA